jgi:hypothetical protein
MVTIPVATWTAINALICIASASRKESSMVGFAVSLGLAALSCGLLSAGAISSWLGLEITVWILHMGLCVLALGVRPPGSANDDLNQISISASIRLAIAMIVFVCL